MFTLHDHDGGQYVTYVAPLVFGEPYPGVFYVWPLSFFLRRLFEIPVFGISSPAARQLSGFVFRPCACGVFLLVAIWGSFSLWLVPAACPWALTP